MTTFVYKKLTRNPEMEIHPSEFGSISRDWGKLCCKMAGLKLLPSLSFKEKLTGGRGGGR